MDLLILITDDESSNTLESLELSLKQMKLMIEGKLRRPAIEELFEADV